MNPNMEFAIKTAQAYNAVCKPLCQELKLPQTAFDILMFLANNPDRRTASDIVEFRHIKANLVSMNVDRLVKEGYLERRAVAGDRRKTELLCTEKGPPGHRAGPRGAECVLCAAADQHRRADPGGLFPDHGNHREKSGRYFKGECMR